MSSTNARLSCLSRIGVAFGGLVLACIMSAGSFLVKINPETLPKLSDFIV